MKIEIIAYFFIARFRSKWEAPLCLRALEGRVIHSCAVAVHMYLYEYMFLSFFRVYIRSNLGVSANCIMCSTYIF